MDRASATRIRLLDGFGVEFSDLGQGSTAHQLPRAVQRLVAHLCLSHAATRTATAGGLWPDVPEEQAHGSLRSVLWRLNKAAPGLIEVSGSALRLAAGVRVDVRELDEWAQRTIAPPPGADDVEVPDAGLLGDLLPGWYDDWVLLERERLHQLRTRALEVVAARLAVLGRHGEALEAAFAAIRAEPLRESAHRTIVRVHLAEGNVADALRAYDFFRIMAQDELGVPPTEQMARLVQGIPQLCGVSAAEHPPPGGAVIRSRVVMPRQRGEVPLDTEARTRGDQRGRLARRSAGQVTGVASAQDHDSVRGVRVRPDARHAGGQSGVPARGGAPWEGRDHHRSSRGGRPDGGTLR